MLEKSFWVNTCERAVRTFCQALLASIGVGAVGFGDVNWNMAVSVAGVAAVVSVLTSVAALSVGPSDSPSITFDPEAGSR